MTDSSSISQNTNTDPRDNLLALQVLYCDKKKEKEIQKLRREIARITEKMNSLQETRDMKKQEVDAAREFTITYQPVTPAQPVLDYCKQCIKYLAENLEADDEINNTNIVKILCYDQAIQFGVQRLLLDLSYKPDVLPEYFDKHEPMVIIACAHALRFILGDFEVLLRKIQPINYRSQRYGVSLWRINEWNDEPYNISTETQKCPLKFINYYSIKASHNELRILSECLEEIWKFDNIYGFTIYSELYIPPM